MSSIRSRVGEWLRRLQGLSLSIALRPLHEELSRRDAERSKKNPGWLLDEEAVTARALLNVVIPSDEETPGLDDIDVLGPAAAEVLETLIRENEERQTSYARGLLAFDLWAQDEYGCPFAQLDTSRQIQLFAQADQLFGRWSAEAPLPLKLFRRLRMAGTSQRGTLFAALLFPQLLRDAYEIFYTSRVSWIWLGYDGPPMNEGYPGLAPRKGTAAGSFPLIPA